MNDFASTSFNYRKRTRTHLIFVIENGKIYESQAEMRKECGEVV